MNVLFAQLFVIDASKVEVGKAAWVLRALFPVIDLALGTKALAPEADQTFSVYEPSAVNAVSHFQFLGE